MKATYVRKEPTNKNDACSFYFLPERELEHTAGQFTELSLKDVGKHWFTISSPPGTKEFSITTRLTGSDFKNALNALKPGDSLDAAEAMGDFVLPVSKSIPIVMVAGGIGITPFLSILGEGLNHPENRSLNLLYAASTDMDFIDLSKYKKLLSSYKQITGQLTAQDILDFASKLDGPYIYTSGPEPMVESLVKELKGSGLPGNRLIGDYFPGYS